jgi:hypothetical protein
VKLRREFPELVERTPKALWAVNYRVLDWYPIIIITMLFDCVRFRKTSNPKEQIPRKHQLQNPKKNIFGFRCFGFSLRGWNSEFI